jgi:hypothetical protein
MPRLLRSVRDHIFAKRRFGNYLLYAVGELILVVAGILIALEVNDWNEARKLVADKRHAERSIHEDFRRNAALLKDALALNERAHGGSFALLALIGSSEAELAKQEVDRLLNEALMAEYYFPSRNAIDDLVGAGRMQWLNAPLRSALHDWSSALETMRTYKEIQTNWQNNHLMPFMLTRFSFRQMDVHNQSAWAGPSRLPLAYERGFGELAFENLLDNNLWLLQFAINQLREIGRIQDRILELTAAAAG